MKQAAVRIAVILGPHGIRGEVKLRSFTENPPDFTAYGPLHSARGEVFEVAKVRPQKGDFVVTFKGASDRNRAEMLKGTELFVSRDSLPEPGDDEVYAHDLVGLPVVRKQGDRLGEIVGIQNYGAGDLLEVALAGGENTVLIPFAASYVVKRLADRVVVDLPEGYLDENA